MNKVAYYRQLEVLSTKSGCYELTCLDGALQGVKLILTAEGIPAAVYQPEWIAEEEIQTQMEGLLSSVRDSLTGKLPSLLMTEAGRVYLEKTGGEQHLILCGAGHVGLALIRMARMIGLHIRVIDDRPSFCDQARAAGADEVLCGPFAETLRQMDDREAPYYVIVTRGHQYDVDCIHEILNKRHSYIGMMGSRVRVSSLRKTLLDEGYDQALLDSLHMPIGLKIGAATPEEIAVSILAEIIQCRRSRARDYHYSREMMAVLTGKTNEETAAALAVIVEKKGCGPREAGTKMLVLEDGRIIGTIGGGCAEAAVIAQARICIRQKCCTLAHVDMTGAEAAEHGLVCGGVMDVFIQQLQRL